MSYTRHTYREALGVDIMTVASAAVRIVEDPCLMEASKLVLRLHELEKGKTALAPGAVSQTKGIGLCSAVAPLRTIVWIKEKPWRLPAIGAAVFGGLFLLGVAVGRASKSGGGGKK